MTPDLEKSIIEKYPSLFANIGQRGSPMCFGLEVGDGWAGIISTMCWILNQKDTSKTFRFDQIKEKFGLLRAYHSGGNEYMAGVVRMAEDMSGRTCEVCGQPGEQRKGGWIKTLCDRCRGGESQVLSQENLTLALSRTGSNSRQTCDNAEECRSHGVKCPERDRLSDAEREAIKVVESDYSDNDMDAECWQIAATLRGLLERVSLQSEKRPIGETPTLTDEEREAVEQAAEHAHQDALHGAAATLRGLLARLGGER